MQRKRILVVDDQLETANAMATLLALLGHEVHEAYDGLHAIEITCQVQPDVILLDIGMPQLDGLETARQIRGLQLRAQPLIVATTGWGEALDRVATDEAGIDVHLLKPIDFDALQRLL